jgi:hypothetical protein
LETGDIYRVHRRILTFSFALLVVVSASCKKKPPTDEKEDDEQIVTLASGSHCGTERWPVKTGTDSQASAIDVTHASDTLIATLTGYPAPPNGGPMSSRIAPQETTEWRLRNVTLTGYKLEADSDFHLVISDGQRTMIVEIPDPGCVGSTSPFTSKIQAARTAFLAKHTPGSWQTANETISVVGAGFFDVPHGQTGVAANAIELHPVLGICWGANCDPGGGTGSSSSSSSSGSSSSSSGSTSSSSSSSSGSASSSSSSGSSASSSGSGTSCAHDLCTVGALLDPTCDPCVKQVCGHYEYCCHTKWTATCVADVKSICGRTCN